MNSKNKIEIATARYWDAALTARRTAFPEIRRCARQRLMAIAACELGRISDTAEKDFWRTCGTVEMAR